MALLFYFRASPIETLPLNLSWCFQKPVAPLARLCGYLPLLAQTNSLSNLSEKNRNRLGCSTFIIYLSRDNL